MRIYRHEISNYRNIGHAELEFCDSVNVLFGMNGQGKTNILESIFLLSGAKSFRKSKDRDLIRNDEIVSIIKDEFEAFGRKQQIELKINDDGRRASLNRGTQGPASKLAGSFLCSVFSPEHLSLVKGAPEIRRTFMDTLLCQISPGYLASLKLYTRLLIQKNNLLKDMRSIAAAYDLIEVFDQQLAEEGYKITKMRYDLCSEIVKDYSEYYRSVSSSDEEVDFKYVSTLADSNELSVETVLKIYKENQKEDVIRGYCGAGPHRDDIYMTINGQDMRVYASQGQQRSAVLALKMTEAEYMEKKTGEKPILLLDDVLSELDSTRQDRLIEKLKGFQSVITCCDPNILKQKTITKMFEVSKGEVSECI